MNVYPSKDIRNVAVVGHSHSGKTTLIEALLATAGAIPAMGRVEDGTAVTAYTKEDTALQMTLANAIAYCEWNGIKINWIDTPGFPMLKHEARAAMLPVELALVVIDAAGDIDDGIGGGVDEGWMGVGIDGMTRRVWGYAQEFNLPRLIVVNRVDHEYADPLGVLEQLQSSLGSHVVPVQWPVALDDGFLGVVDLITMQAYAYDAASNGHGKQISIPLELVGQTQNARAELVERVGKSSLAGKKKHTYHLAEADLIPVLRMAIRENRIFPVMFTAGLKNLGCDRLLEFLRMYTPAPTEREPVAATVAAQAILSRLGSFSGGVDIEAEEVGQSTIGQTEWPIEMVTRAVSDSEPLALFAFKTLTDPLAGHISFFKIFSGCAHNDDTVMHHKLHLTEKLAHLSVMQGKLAVAVSELHAGDIGAVPQLKNTHTGDTLADRNHPIFYEPIQ